MASGASASWKISDVIETLPNMADLCAWQGVFRSVPNSCKCGDMWLIISTNLTEMAPENRDLILRAISNKNLGMFACWDVNAYISELAKYGFVRLKLEKGLFKKSVVGSTDPATSVFNAVIPIPIPVFLADGNYIQMWIETGCKKREIYGLDPVLPVKRGLITGEMDLWRTKTLSTESSMIMWSGKQWQFFKSLRTV